MVRQIRAIEVALGDGVKWPNPSEERIKPLVRRRIVAAHNLPAGTRLDWEHLCFKRADQGLYVEQAESLIGRQLNRPLGEDEPLDWMVVGDYELASPLQHELCKGEGA